MKISMTEKRKKGTGCEEVKRYILGRLRERPDPDDPFVRITGDEISESLGISPQMVNTHVRTLVRLGIIHRERRCFYSEVPQVDSMPIVSAVPQPIFRPAEGPATLPISWPGTSVGPAVASTESFTVPVEDFLGIFTDVSGKQYYVFRNFPKISRTGSEDIRTSFPEVSKTSEPCFSEISGNVSETSHDSKKEYQERTENIKKDKCVEFLGNFVDSTSEEYRKAHEYASQLFVRHGAGIRKGTNPKLVNRFVAGFMLKIPLINFQELEEQLKQAEQETAQYESYRGFGKQTGIRRPYIRIANYLKKYFEAAGWTWTKLTTPFDLRLKRAHKQPDAAPVFSQIQSEQESEKPIPGSKSVLTVPTESQLLESGILSIGKAPTKPEP